MTSYDDLTRSDIASKIREIDEQATEELAKENVDKKRLFELRYRQMLQGLYLQNTSF